MPINDILKRLILGKGSWDSKNDRILRLLGLLRSQEFATTKSLAKELGTSHRTLMRDLNELRMQGYPIDSDRGKGGGTRLRSQWGLNQIELNEREVISLLLSLTILEKNPPIGTELNAKMLQQKIANAFPDHLKRRVYQLRKRILIGQNASVKVIHGFGKSNGPAIEKALLGFFEGKKIIFKYQDEKRIKSDRLVDPCFLCINWPVWYFLAWDERRKGIRFFRFDRILEARVLDEPMGKHEVSKFFTEYEKFFAPL